MEALPMKIDHSRTALSRHSRKLAEEALGAGSSFLEQTREAGQALAAEACSVGRNFLERTRAASSELLGRTRSAGEEWLREMRSEAEAWRSHMRTRPSPPRGNGRTSSSAERLQRTLLTSAQRALGRLDDRIEGRLEDLDVGQRPEPVVRPVEAPPRAVEAAPRSVEAVPRSVEAPPREEPAPKTRSTPPSGRTKTSRQSRPAPTRPPLRGYDDMTAKQLVSRLDTLSRDQLRAIVAYEKANKQRATVLRAAEQRLAA